MDKNLKRILERIVNEVGDCGCDDHAVRFGREDVRIARAALLASEARYVAPIRYVEVNSD